MHRRLPLSVVSLLLAGLWLVACGDDPAPRNKDPILTGPFVQAADVTSGAQVQLSLEATDADGDTLTYEWVQTPTAPAGTFSDPSAASPVWTAPQVTAATNFQLGVTVSDGKGANIRRAVSVLVRPPPPTNRAPVIGTGSPGATPSSVTGSASVQLSLSATDPDSDPLTYSWSQEPATPVGSFSGLFVATPTWTSPVVSTATPFTLKVTVADGRGGSVQGQVTVTVAPPNPANNPPTITARPSASATTINEQTSTNLSVSASDLNGDTLTYAWTQTSPTSPLGAFSDPNVATPTWTAPDVTANGVYTLRVTISDGQGGSVQDTVAITVQKVNQPPTVGATITGPGTLLAGSTGTFTLSASDPDGDTLTYSWTQTTPATPQGTWVSGRTSSSAQWFSPAIGTQTTFTLSVSVTDGQSTPVVRTIDVPATVPQYTADIQTIFTSVCTSCHIGTGPPADLNLTPGMSYSALVNVTAVQSLCNTLYRVTPNDPDNSVLILKMIGTACGTRMPQSNPTYFDSNPGLVVRVRSWILAGAANN